MKRENWIDKNLTELRETDTERHLRAYPQTGGKLVIDGQRFLNFSSNDYLNLVHHPDVLMASQNAISHYGAGSTASRLVTGTTTLHEELERALAQHKGYSESLLFGSGFLANVGTIPALVEREDMVFADKLVHASIVDGIVLSRAKLQRFEHNNVEHLEELLQKAPANKKKLVVTESVFSMDGDLAPLKEIATVAEKYGAMLMIDEAHATGVFGPNGSGLIAEHGLQEQVNCSMFTLSKALGGYGGAVACSALMKQWLVNRARAFIYTTSLPPAVVGAALGSLIVLKNQTNLGHELLRRAALFRNLLQDAGLNTLQSASPIIPIHVGENAKALAFSKRLRDEHILAVAIRPPTVPTNTARLRLSVTLAHEETDLREAAKTIIEAAQKEGVV